MPSPDWSAIPHQYTRYKVTVVVTYPAARRLLMRRGASRMRPRRPSVAMSVAPARRARRRARRCRPRPPPRARADEPAAARTSTATPTRRTSARRSTAAVAKVHAEVDPQPRGQDPRGRRRGHARRLREARPAPGPAHAHRELVPRHHAPLRDRARGPRSRPGQRWDQALVDETARNLRGLPQLSLVLCVPLRGSAPGQRAPARHHQGRVEPPPQLQLHLRERAPPVPPAPAERGEPARLAPAGATATSSSIRRPSRSAAATSCRASTAAASALSVSASAIVNRATGQRRGLVRLVQLRAAALLDARRSGRGAASLGWDYEIMRRFVGGQFTDFDPTTGQCASRRRAAPRRTTRRAAGTARRAQRLATPSRARGARCTSTTSRSACRREPPPSTSPRPLRLLALREQRGLRSRAHAGSATRRSGLTSSTTTTRARFVDVLDFETLGLTENFRRGHELLLHVAPIITALNSTRNFVDVLAAARLHGPLGDGLVRGIVQSNTEIGTESAPPADAGPHPRRRPSRRACASRRRASASAASSSTRTCSTATRTTSTPKSSLGGDSRLRGYPSGAFIGNDFFAANLEYRSAPRGALGGPHRRARPSSTRGDAFNDFTQISSSTSVGVGARVRVPAAPAHA